MKLSVKLGCVFLVLAAFAGFNGCNKANSLGGPGRSGAATNAPATEPSLDDLLPKCVERGISIVVGGPLNSGILAGRDTGNYRTAPAEVVARVEAIRVVCDRHRIPLAAAALQFPLAHPAVAAIIPGPRNADEFGAKVSRLLTAGAMTA